MIKDKHYVDEDLFVSFDAFQDGKPAKVMTSRVNAYSPESKLLVAAPCQHKGNQVSYRLTKNNVDKPGEYTFVFKAILRYIGQKAHVMKINVSELPVSGKIQKKENE